MAIKKFAAIFLIIFETSSASLTYTFNSSDIETPFIKDTANKVEPVFNNDLFNTYEDDPLLDMSTPEPSFLEKTKNWILIRLVHLMFSASSGYDYLKNKSGKSLAFMKLQLQKMIGLRKNHERK